MAHLTATAGASTPEAPTNLFDQFAEQLAQLGRDELEGIRDGHRHPRAQSCVVCWVVNQAFAQIPSPRSASDR